MKTDLASPDRLLQIAFAFRSSKALLSAVELGVFAALKDGPLGLEALAPRIGIHCRGARDFFDALVSLGALDRDAGGRYHNAPDCACYLDPSGPAYVGDLLEYLNARVYGSWGLLTAALRSGKPQAGPSAVGGYAAFYKDQTQLESFLRGMTAGSLLPARALAAAFPWTDYRTIVDIGTAQGCVPVEIARAHPHLTGGGFDLPALASSFKSYVGKHGLGKRLKFYGGDFFHDPLPSADVLVMGRILHNWDVKTRKLLLRKAHAALPPGGVLIVCETLIDDARRGRAHGLLASLNMLIQTEGGSEFTGDECRRWMHAAGFGSVRIQPLGMFYSAAIAAKDGVTGPPATE
jgi:O-methyltransferase/methyltransferase family protein